MNTYLVGVLLATAPILALAKDHETKPKSRSLCLRL